VIGSRLVRARSTRARTSRPAICKSIGMREGLAITHAPMPAVLNETESPNKVSHSENALANLNSFIYVADANRVIINVGQSIKPHMDGCRILRAKPNVRYAR
jgi:hypothetical protein